VAFIAFHASSKVYSNLCIAPSRSRSSTRILNASWNRANAALSGAMDFNCVMSPPRHRSLAKPAPNSLFSGPSALRNKMRALPTGKRVEPSTVPKKMEPMPGLEPGTSSLPRTGATNPQQKNKLPKKDQRKIPPRLNREGLAGWSILSTHPRDTRLVGIRPMAGRTLRVRCLQTVKVWQKNAVQRHRLRGR
jgi:hypothetical protein